MISAFCLGVLLTMAGFALYLRKKSPSNAEIVRGNEEIISRTMDLNAMAQRDIIKGKMLDEMARISELYESGKISSAEFAELSQPLLSTIQLHDLPYGVVVSSGK